MTPEAVPAVDSTRPGCHKQRPTCVFLHQAWDPSGRLVADWIAVEAGYDGRFGRRRQDLQEQRIVRITGFHAGDESVRDKEREVSQADPKTPYGLFPVWPWKRFCLVSGPDLRLTLKPLLTVLTCL